jgi:hypothetical protein
MRRGRRDWRPWCWGWRTFRSGGRGRGRAGRGGSVFGRRVVWRRVLGVRSWIWIYRSRQDEGSFCGEGQILFSWIVLSNFQSGTFAPWLECQSRCLRFLQGSEVEYKDRYLLELYHLRLHHQFSHLHRILHRSRALHFRSLVLNFLLSCRLVVLSLWILYGGLIL